MRVDDYTKVLRFAQKQQDLGLVLGWSVDRGSDLAEFFVPDDVSADSFPTHIGKVRIVLTWLPRAMELLR